MSLCTATIYEGLIESIVYQKKYPITEKKAIFLGGQFLFTMYLPLSLTDIFQSQRNTFTRASEFNTEGLVQE